MSNDGCGFFVLVFFVCTGYLWLVEGAPFFAAVLFGAVVSLGAGGLAKAYGR